jgi:preprotein translocase subunit YajC
MILLIAIILFIILVLCQVRKKDRQEGYGYTINDYSVQWSNKAGIENNVQKWIFVFVNKKGEKYHTKQFEKGTDPDTMFKNFTTVDNTKLIDNKTFDVDISGTNKLKVYYNTEDTNHFITEKDFVYSDFGIALSDVQFTVPPPEKVYYSWKYYKKQIQGVSQLKDLVPDNSGTVETLGPYFSSDPISDFRLSNDFDDTSEGTLYYEGHFYANQVKDLRLWFDYYIFNDNDFMKIYIDGKLQLNIDSDTEILWGPTREDELNYTFIKDQTHKIQIITTSEKSMYLFFDSNELVDVLEKEIYFTKKKFKYNDPVNIPEDAVGEIIVIEPEPEPETEIDRTGEFVWQLFEDDGYLADVSSFLDLTPTKTGLTKTIKNKTDGTGGTLLDNSGKDNYGVKWTGYFVPKKSGYHGFSTQSDDMSYLYIDGLKVVDNGGLHGMVTKSAYVTLEKDKTYKLEIYFSEKGGGDEIIVKFRESFTSTWKDTFDGYLTPFDYEPLLKVSIIVEPEPEPETEIDRTGEFVWQLFEDDGYLADVSSFLDLTPNKTGVTKTIKNKTYGTGGTLLNNSGKDNYGVKWTGYFVPKTTGNHEFNTRSDDMSYLYIDGDKVVDNGGLHGMVTKSGYVTLEKDKIYKLEIYFSEKGGGDDIIVKFREPFSLTWKDTFDGYLTSFDNVSVSNESLPVNCEGFYDENWSVCSATCGGGTQTKKWNITVSPENGGDVCPPSTITQSCNTQSCPPPPSSTNYYYYYNTGWARH